MYLRNRRVIEIPYVEQNIRLWSADIEDCYHYHHQIIIVLSFHASRCSVATCVELIYDAIPLNQSYIINDIVLKPSSSFSIIIKHRRHHHHHHKFNVNIMTSTRTSYNMPNSTFQLTLALLHTATRKTAATVEPASYHCFKL